MPIASDTLTTSLLLERLHDVENVEVWREFNGRYVPIIVAFARRMGLSHADAADAAQETLVRFITDYRQGKYDRSRGRLRSWIVGIMKYRVLDLKREGADRRIVRGASAMSAVPGDDEMEQAWEEEHRRALLREAFDELRSRTKLQDRTILAFQRFVLDEQPASVVAAELGLSVDDVYMAKIRVSEKLREIVLRLEALYNERDP